MSEEKLAFQTEVSRLLQIVASSLYSDKKIFLRELISNASDACDRLRHAALTDPALTQGDPEFRVRISVDKAARAVEISDNGIGMNRETLISDLGTIARSGTSAFVDGLTGDAKKDVALIGQFGVGFYSGFMVADKVEVTSRRAGEDQAWRWESDGLGEFTIAEAARDGRGTTIRLHLKKDEDAFLDPAELKRIVRQYSDHIALPIVFVEDGKEETVNQASALWTRPKSEITEDQYKEFYHHVGHGFDDPWLTLHWRAEGMIEYGALVFVPSMKPFDLFNPERKSRLKLYVKRVFITDDCEELIPSWLRFLRGIVDSEDLPLNVSREMLQHNPMVTRIRAGIVKRVLDELDKKAEGDAEGFAAFWDNFGAVVKEGLYEDGDSKDRLLKLARFRSTAGDGLVSLADYTARLKDGQDAIFYITGEDLEAVKKSPQLEGFRARGVEVLLLTDPVDEFWLPTIGEYDGKKFKSATRGGADLAKIKTVDTEMKDDADADKPDPGKTDAVIAMIRLALGDEVKDVRISERLTDSAVCLVADEGDLDIRLERMLKAHKQLEQSFKRILEINPKHKLIRSLAEAAGKDAAAAGIEDAAWLLLDQARIVEGEPLPDPAAFSRRLSDMMARGLAV